MDVTIAAALLSLLLVLVTWMVFRRPSRAKFLDKTRQKLVLGERFQISHDTVRFRFTLPARTPVLGLPVGKHFKVFAPCPRGKVAGEWNGREDPEAKLTEVERKYTPCSSDSDIGHVDLVIKVYKGGAVERFPDGGKMSQYLDRLKVGDAVTISGPWGMNEYLGNGLLKVGKDTRSCARLGMMAGGTGITPMLQVSEPAGQPAYRPASQPVSQSVARKPYRRAHWLASTTA